MADLQLKLRRDVNEYGWHILNVVDTDDHPPHSYSVGLYRTFKHPEVVIVGLPGETAQHVINDVGAKIKKGRTFVSGERSAEFLNGYDVAFASVAQSVFPNYFGQAIDYYGSLDFPVLQLVWPDRERLFPWDQGFDESLHAQQPLLSTSGDLSLN